MYDFIAITVPSIFFSQPLNETNDEAWYGRLRTRQTDTSIYEDLVLVSVE